MRHILLLFGFLTGFGVFVQAQRNNFLSRSELGFLVGGSYYFGDLNQFHHFRNTKPAAQLLYRFNVHSRTSFRVNFTYAQVEAWDSDNTSNQLLYNRNLSFHSDIYELSGGVEFNYFPFVMGHDRYKGTAYLLVELGVFRMNPKTNYNGDEIELQPLGTEGQGSYLSSKSNYSLTQVCIPLGMGCKLSLGDRATLNIEYGIRKTFTDYIDDVGSDTYMDNTELAAANGPLAAALSNRSLDQNRFGKRGTSATKDWYAFFGIGVTFKLGSPGRCPFPM